MTTPPLQNHIHLDVSLGDPPEKSPILKWKTVNRIPVPSITATYLETLVGESRLHTLSKKGVGVVQKVHMKYSIKVAADETYNLLERLSILKQFLGHAVYLVDHFHPNDGEDHTDYVIPMLFAEMGEIPPIAPQMPYFVVDILLRAATKQVVGQPKLLWRLDHEEFGTLGSTTRLT